MEEFEIDLENNKPELEKKLNKPILKFAQMTKICYIGPEKKAEDYKEGERVNDVANMVFNSAASGTLDVCPIEFANSKQDSNVNIIFQVISVKENCESLIKIYIQELGFLIIDEYCSDASKEELRKLIFDKAVDANICIFVNRSGGKTEFENLIPAKNIIDASNPIDVVEKIRDIAGEKNLLAKDEKMPVNINEEDLPVKNEKVKINEQQFKKLKKLKKLKGFGKLFGKVKEHKGKVLGGLITIFGLEELWRHGVFSGKKTDEKTKITRSEKKNNSAAT